MKDLFLKFTMIIFWGFSFQARSISTCSVPILLSSEYFPGNKPRKSSKEWNSVSYEEFLNFYEKKTYFKVAINNDKTICGFLLVLPSGLDYQSLNYKWFTERYRDFADSENVSAIFF